MPTLLEKALEKVGALPQEEQDAIAAQILETIADEEGWRRRFARNRDVIRRMADEALAEDARQETEMALSGIGLAVTRTTTNSSELARSAGRGEKNIRR